MTICSFAIRVYQQFVAPLLPLGCRYYPTCSHFTAEAIARHGARRGVGLGARRILRCHPFAHGGIDPVPDVAAALRPATSAGSDFGPPKGGRYAPTASNPHKEPAR